MKEIKQLLSAITSKKSSLHNKDFLLTWEQSHDELEQVLLLAQAIRTLREQNIDSRVFRNGLGISLFCDNSTRTRFSYAAALNLLGLTQQDLDEGFACGVLPQRPAIVNLQCDIDHPTQSMADLAWLKQHFGGLDKLKGKKIAMTRAYSPSYGKPLSVPQGIIGLMTRFGMHVSLAHPQGYDLLPEVLAVARKNAAESGGSFQYTDSMRQAFVDADIVYPKSWASWKIMQKRTDLLRRNDFTDLKTLEQACLAQNASHQDWHCTEQMMKHTKGGEGLYTHCLPADITGVSCETGEVEASVFERYRTATYKEASWKPYVIAAMLIAHKFANAAQVPGHCLDAAKPRIAG